MTTLSDIMEDVLFELGDFKLNVATGGTTSTIVDSDLGGNDNDWNEGTAIITYDAGGAAAAPESQFAEVTDYVASTGTLTLGTALTVACAAGDEFMVSSAKFPHREVIKAINRALQSLGDIPKVDTTTLDTASSQTEYACAVAWKRSPPYRIDIQQVTTDANDNQWRIVRDWYYVPADAGSTGLIIFRDQLTPSRDLRVWYRGLHDAVRTYSGTIYEGFHPELVVWESVYHIYRWKVSQGDDMYLELMKDANEQRQEMRALHPVWKPKREPKLLIVKPYSQLHEDEMTVPNE